PICRPEPRAGFPLLSAPRPNGCRIVEGHVERPRRRASSREVLGSLLYAHVVWGVRVAVESDEELPNPVLANQPHDVLIIWCHRVPVHEQRAANLSETSVRAREEVTVLDPSELIATFAFCNEERVKVPFKRFPDLVD